jgi:hypothetical protein
MIREARSPRTAYQRRLPLIPAHLPSSYHPLARALPRPLCLRRSEHRWLTLPPCSTPMPAVPPHPRKGPPSRANLLLRAAVLRACVAYDSDALTPPGGQRNVWMGGMRWGRGYRKSVLPAAPLGCCLGTTAARGRGSDRCRGSVEGRRRRHGSHPPLTTANIPLRLSLYSGSVCT